jgi:hypothetical protein
MFLLGSSRGTRFQTDGRNPREPLAPVVRGHPARRPSFHDHGRGDRQRGERRQDRLQLDDP